MLTVTAGAANSQYRPETSVAGFYTVENSGRKVWNFDTGWKFYRGDKDEAFATNFDDSDWDDVNLPHTVELMPAEASGCRNYQGKAWYRKRFVVPDDCLGRQITLHFEAVMGRQEIYVDGVKVLEHKGGYTPFTIDLSAAGVEAGKSCTIAVMTDNSDDGSYPPGKPQTSLDFCYHGGIYRDVWLIAKSEVAISDAVEANRVAGGGVMVHCSNIGTDKATVTAQTDVENRSAKSRTVTVESRLLNRKGEVVGKRSNRITIAGGGNRQIGQSIEVVRPELWSPEDPALYRLETRILEGTKSIDGGATRLGIRSAEWRGKEGFFLNGKRYEQLVGTNRHQDFAYVGNAMPNSQHWRDAKLLRDAGCRIIRTAHYPQDPSFMDACDELGLFVIVATPGWQFWNKNPEFGAAVHNNTRQIIRRDRNHPSVLLWEPILNETHYPADFSVEALQITREEYPFEGAPEAAADLSSEGVRENYKVVYCWADDDMSNIEQSIFTREFGENVDDWYAHNCNNRASRSWGEEPMKVQALSLAESYDKMYKTDGQFTGGAQWHSFDHQRGYHPDPYWGGLCDAFRQPKYAYYMFRSQMPVESVNRLIDARPMIFVLNEMTPFSSSDVVVFTNCDSVRLTAYEGRSVTKRVEKGRYGMPHAPVVFENQFDFWEAREWSYRKHEWQKISFVVEGFVDGKVVCTEKKMPSRRSTKITLRLDNQGQPLTADGSDFAVVVAEVTDDNGNVRRLAKEQILFEVEGEGRIVGDASIGANPRTVEFGSAPVLIRSTSKAGRIKVTAKVPFGGAMAPSPAELEFESVASPFESCGTDAASLSTNRQNSNRENRSLSNEQRAKILDEVGRQQTEFGTKE